MAYAEQLPSGQYRGVAVHPVTKRRKTATKHPDTGERMTHDECLMWAEGVERDMREGADTFGATYRALPPRATKGITWADYADDWLARSFRWSRATRENYSGAVRRMRHYTAAGRPLRALRADDVERMLSDMIDAGVPPASVKYNLLVFGTVCRDAVRKGKAEQDPTKGVRAARVQARSWVLLDDDEAVALFRAMRPDLRALILLGYDAGLRISEALAVTRFDVNFKRNRINVRAQVDDKTRELAETKGRAAREVPMTPRLANALRWHIEEFGTAPSSDALFRTNTLRLYTSTQIYAPLNRAVEAAGLAGRGFVFHDLRHAFCTRLAQTQTMTMVQLLAGHAHPSTTLRYVHHVQNDDAASAAIAGLAGVDPLRPDDEGDEGTGGATLSVVGQ